MWERAVPAIKFMLRVVITPEQFQQSPEVKADPRHWSERLAKCLLETDTGPRWHLVDVHRHNGLADHLARPISVRLYRSED
jgi:hypothetical protein